MSKRENISIHALREEGDLPVSTICTASCKFLSTPSARRATHFCFRGPHCVVISIHALREEGDIQDRPETPKGGISIHALREEGDPVRLPWWCQSSYFYPRPPRGGRHQRSGEPGCGGRISIHALREEGDASSESAASTKRQFLSTPSARRATLPRLPEKPYMEISIHALREEGDTATTSPHGSQSYFYPRPPRGGRLPRGFRGGFHSDFYPRPPRGGRPMFPEQSVRHEKISIHALREEGDTYRLVRLAKFDEFLSTPSARRATTAVRCPLPRFSISIHALREEGDNCGSLSTAKVLYFYPRPPRGGRRTPAVEQFQLDQFLSTPSARRATGPRRGDTPFRGISIHALREEGDGLAGGGLGGTNNFYPRPPRGGRRKGHVLQADRVIFLSTPSARRATRSVFAESIKCTSISIHALREEGDAGAAAFGRCRTRISIHALREEGDQGGASTPSGAQDFYPRPPRGGRPVAVSRQLLTEHFYPRPPRGGRLADVVKQRVDFLISIHALREEGDVQCVINCVQLFEFLSTPSARRATANIGEQAILNKISIHALREEGDGIRAQPATAASRFLSTPSARRATRAHCNGHRHYQISIHALREEGDGIRL